MFRRNRNQTRVRTGEWRAGAGPHAPSVADASFYFSGGDSGGNLAAGAGLDARGQSGKVAAAIA